MTAFRTRNDHPDEMTTAAYLDGGLSPGALAEFEAHLVGCDSCRAGVMLLRASPPPAADAVPAEFIRRAKAARFPGPLRRRLLPIAAGIAASALVLAGVTAWWFRDRLQAPPSETYRGGAAAGFSLLAPAPGSVVPADRILFRWNPVPGADRYEISVLDGRGGTLARFTVPGSELTSGWPESQPPPPPGPLVGRIRALSLDRVLAESRPVAFEIR